jgi:protein TonB
MIRLIRSFIVCAIALMAFGINVFCQSNLTAKGAKAQPAPAAVEDSDRVRDGLVGPVRRVRTEVAKLANENGRQVEAKHNLLELVSYDVKGNKVENQYFPIAGASLTGKEVYKYDEKGNINEMTLLNADGSLLSKEIYRYEFDFAGNWNKMTTSVAVVDGGKLSFEPSEVTYRSIMYYLDANMLKMAQPGVQPAAQPATQPTGNTTTQATGNTALAPNTNSTAANNQAPANLQPKTAEVPKPSNSTSSTSSKLKKNSVELPGSANPLEKTAATVELANSHTGSNADEPVVNIGAEPPPPTARPLLKPVSGGVLNGTAITMPMPTYPETARRMRIGGVVSVDVIVDETGKVISAVASSGSPMLRDVAVQAALKARFSPTKLSGQPVKVSGVINYKFALSQ